MNELNKTETQLIYILECAVNNIVPEKEIIDEIDMEQLFKLCQKHKLTSIVENVLEKIGIKNNQFYQEKQKAIRNQIYYEHERNQILKELENNKIWYMPLKGIIMKDLYPNSSMRQMADNDILFDSAKQDLVIKIMTKLGFEVKCIKKYDHDIFYKNNILNFEMHKQLYGIKHNPKFYQYYKNIKEKLLKDDNNQYGYHFKDEDFYLFMMTHDYKHFYNGGTGIRGLLDCFVFLNKKEKLLDWNYISNELKKLDIIEFEKERRELAKKLYSPNGISDLNEQEKEKIKEYMNAGAYGTYETVSKRRIAKYFNKTRSNSKIKYMLSRVFPSYEYMKELYPVLSKNRLILPIGYIYRIIRGIFKRNKKIRIELKEVKKYDISSV